MPIPAVILAAGRATRLRPFTDHMPKCLLEVGGVAMLERSLRNLHAAGIREVVLVTGFARARLHAALAAWRLELHVHLVDNPAFDRSNNAASLLCAADVVGDRRFLLLDSDLVYDHGLVGELLARPGSTVALRRTADLGAEEVKLSVDGDERVTAIGKDLALDCAEGESVGIELFAPADAAHLFATLRQRLRGQGLVDEYYEASFQQMIDEGAHLTAVDIAPRRAMEVDTAADLLVAERTFGHTATRLSSPGLAATGRPIAS